MYNVGLYRGLYPGLYGVLTGITTSEYILSHIPAPVSSGQPGQIAGKKKPATGSTARAKGVYWLKGCRNRGDNKIDNLGYAGKG